MSFRVERRTGPVWYRKYRLTDGRQVQKKIGPAWTERGRPPDGWYTKRTAEAWLQDVLHDARRRTPAASAGASVIFAAAAEEWLRFIAEDRERKPSTLRDYCSALSAHLLPAFGEMQLEEITPEVVEQSRRSLAGLSNRSKNKLLIQLHGIFRRAQMVWGLAANPLARVEKHPMRPSGDIQVFSPEEVWALVRAATSEQDGALFLTASFTGLRSGRAPRPSVARRRLRSLDDPSAHELGRRPTDDAEVRRGPCGAHGARRRHGAGAARPAYRLGGRR